MYGPEASRAAFLTAIGGLSLCVSFAHLPNASSRLKLTRLLQGYWDDSQGLALALQAAHVSERELEAARDIISDKFRRVKTLRRAATGLTAAWGVKARSPSAASVNPQEPP